MSESGKDKFGLSKSMNQPFAFMNFGGDIHNVLSLSQKVVSDSVSANEENINPNDEFRLQFLGNDGQHTYKTSHAKKRDLKYQSKFDNKSSNKVITITFDDALISIFKDIAHYTKRQADLTEQLLKFRKQPTGQLVENQISIDACSGSESTPADSNDNREEESKDELDMNHYENHDRIMKADLDSHQAHTYYCCLEAAGQHKDLAHYFYMNDPLFNDKTKSNYKTMYEQCMKGLKKFNLAKIRLKLLAIDSTNKETKQNLYRKWNLMTKIANQCYSIKNKDIPSVKFFSK